MATPSKAELPRLPQTWELPESIRGRVGRDAGPQRAIIEDGHLLLILHQPPEPAQRERIPAFFWRNPAGEWKAPGSKTAGIGCLTEFLSRYESRLAELSQREIEANTAAEYHALLEAAAPVLRASRGLHQALQQAREAVKSDRDLINFRDKAAALEREGELLLQDAKFGLTYTGARQAEVQAESARRMASTAHRLNILAAVFLPITAITGIFSMNIETALKDNPAAFWGVVAAGAIIGIVLARAISRHGG